ncbi:MULTISPECIES: glycosyltransferase family 4 protein [unclassified Proteiniphilum]|jgi:glycosyltransferase involved in cell wall biosynthesis|uniref:glycosyltransferase family 4 protein n=1 Tax=unclassified Proteiniphilum TaxID=2622718 RepID=UPI000E7D6122|nr:MULTISPECIES: glycosyltransferase family 1 protein [unclassified Proteiniphilum]HBK41423.1 alpha-D-mannose-alpha,1-6-phosphatidyl myo-inositol monomannoside transferase [Porphyromonadaceae bacterium]
MENSFDLEVIERKTLFKAGNQLALHPNGRIKYLSPPTVKVAFFADILIKDFDGAIKTIYQLIERIPKVGFAYTFFTGTAPEHRFKHKVIKTPAIRIPFNISYKMAFPRLSRAKLLLSLSKLNPDVVHITTPSAIGFFGLDYAKRNNKPVLSIYHTHFVSYVKYYLKYAPFLIKPVESVIKKIYKVFYNQCDIVYVPTQKIMEELQAYGVSGSVMKLWQRGIDSHLFNPSKRDINFIRNLTGNDKPCILFVSRLVWEKNVETLFGIYDEIESQGIDVNFVIAGNGVAEEKAKLKMKNAIFLGFLDHENLAKVYASCDIFVFTSISETYGNVVIEAMSSGCVPVIANGGGSKALVKDGITGFLCEPDNPTDYINKIKTLLNNKQLREKMQTAGYEYALPLCWDELSREYFKDIESLAHVALPNKENRRL